MTPLEQVYQSVKDRVSWLEFCYQMRDCEIVEIFLDGTCACILTLKGPEFHITTFKDRSFSRREIRRFVLDPLISEYGYAETKTPIDDKRQQRFNDRFGFIRTGEDEQYVYYRFEG